MPDLRVFSLPDQDIFCVHFFAHFQYDPGVLEVIDTNAAQNGTQIQPGNIFSIIGDNDTYSNDGVIWYSAHNLNTDVFYSGTGIIATVRFHVIASVPQTEVSLYFSPNWSTDSNVSTRSTEFDQLQQVDTAVFAITGSPERIPPTINISTNYDYLNSEKVNLSVTAEDLYNQVESVEMYAYYDNSWHNLVLDSDPADGWFFDWDTTGILEQVVWFQAVSYIHGSNYYYSDMISYLLDRTSPEFINATFTPPSPSS